MYNHNPHISAVIAMATPVVTSLNLPVQPHIMCGGQVSEERLTTLSWPMAVGSSPMVSYRMTVAFTASHMASSAVALVAAAAIVSTSRRGQRRLRAQGVSLQAIGQATCADDGGLNRRQAILNSTVAQLGVAVLPAAAKTPDAGGARLASLTPATLATAKGKVVVITGATSGVGLEAARSLVSSGAEASTLGKAMPLELDLASFASVRQFADQWKATVQRPIDVLALNAGLALKTGLKPEEAPLSRDGLELTVATNHLGHFLLYNLIEDRLSPKARVVVTASSVHDPATGDPGTQATLGDLSGLGKKGPAGLMVDGAAYDSGKSYKDSKLCNVLLTLELARRLQRRGSLVTVNCLSPGLIPSKTFFRNQSSGFADVFAFAAKNVLRIAETTEFGGDTLCYMALDPSLNERSGLFYSAIPPGQHVFVEKQPSSEALNEAEAQALWQRSAQLVGV